jgi:hypothetical protein
MIVKGYNPTTTINSTSSVKVYGAISSGEIIISILLLIIIVIFLLKNIADALARVNTRKKYLGYSNSDVEIKDDLS